MSTRARAILIGALAITIIALSWAAVVYWLFPQETGTVTLELMKPEQIALGQPFVLTASIANSGKKDVSNARLIVSLPTGIAVVGSSPDIRVAEVPLGALAAETSTRPTVRLIALNGAQTIKRIEARVMYSVGGDTSAQFEAKAGEDLMIGAPAVSLNFITPPKVVSGQNFEASVVIESNADAAFDQLGFQFTYAPIFQFREADPRPTTGNNSWDLGAFPRGTRRVIKVQGSAVGPEQSYFGFHGELTTTVAGRTYVLNAQEASLAISVSPLSIAVTAGPTPQFVATAGEPIPYSLRYQNNSAVTFENIIITATVSGEMLDFSRARSRGSLNSLTNTFTWNPANTTALARLAPGQSGVLELTMPVFAKYPIKRPSDKNYTAKIHVQIESPTVPEATGAAKTVSVTDLETKIGGRIDLGVRALYHETTTGIANAGPYPPQVNTPTEYTIHWRLTNYGTDLSNVRVAASILSNTRFVRAVTSTNGILPKFNPASGEVSWDLAQLGATKGFLDGPLEVIFQIENTPAINEMTGPVNILSETKLSAIDVFTGQTLRQDARILTTASPDDMINDRR